MQELAQDINIAFLPTNQAYGSRRQNCSSDPVRLIGRSCEILHRLADAPHASVTLACSAEELLDHRTQAGGLEQRPTLVKNRHAAGAAAAFGTLGRCIGDQQAHCRLELRIVLQLFDVEIEPRSIHVNRSLTVEQLGINPIVNPCSQLDGSDARLLHDQLFLILVQVVFQFVPHVAKCGDTHRAHARTRIGIKDGGLDHVI